MSYAAYPVRDDLGASALSFDTSSDVFVADEILPPYDVMSQSAAFDRYGVEVDLQMPASNKRAPGDDFRELTFGRIEDNYRVAEHGDKSKIDMAQEWTAEKFLREEEKKSRRLIRVTRAMREKRVADLTVNSSVFAHGTSYGVNAGATWSTTGTPLTDLETMIQKIIDQSGAMPNRLKLTRRQWSAASKNSELSARYRSDMDNAGNIELSRLQDILGIEKIIIDQVPYNTAPDGATPTVGRVWSDSKVLMWHARFDENVEDVQLGRTMVWDAPGLSGGLGSTVAWQNHPRWREYAHFQNVQEKIFCPQCAYVLHNVLS